MMIRLKLFYSSELLLLSTMFVCMVTNVVSGLVKISGCVCLTLLMWQMVSTPVI